MGGALIGKSRLLEIDARESLVATQIAAPHQLTHRQHTCRKTGLLLGTFTATMSVPYEDSSH